MIIEQKVYDGKLIHSRFAYDFFNKDTNPLGNIVAFEAPMDVSLNLIDKEDLISQDYIWSDCAINFCWEIPNLCPFGAVAFQRLFNTGIANILSRYINKPIEVAGDDLLIHAEFVKVNPKTFETVSNKKGKASVSITYSKNNVALGHTGINIIAGNKSPSFAFSTELIPAQSKEFMESVIEYFYHEVNSLFIATTKITL